MITEFILFRLSLNTLIYEHNIYKVSLMQMKFLLLLLPGLDLLRLTFIRLLKNKNPFYGDRNHIHHLLTNRFSLFISNSILIIMGILPIALFNLLKLNFF